MAPNGLLGVFHVGSTAIPDVPGKPALDIIAVYDDEKAMMTAIESLTDDDRYEREAGSTVSIRWADAYAVFIKAHTSGDEKVASQLLFRDYLRENQKAREVRPCQARGSKDTSSGPRSVHYCEVGGRPFDTRAGLK